MNKPIGTQGLPTWEEKQKWQKQVKTQQKISYAWSFTNNTLKFVRNRKNKQDFSSAQPSFFVVVFFFKEKIQKRKWIDSEIIWITLNIGSFNEWKSEVLLCFSPTKITLVDSCDNCFFWWNAK